MVARTLQLPKKLKQDAILEAVFEVRFVQTGVPEIFFGRFVDHQNWRSYKPRKLPFPDLPPQILQIDPNLRFMPIFEAVAPDGQSKITVGNQAAAFHRASPYPGWSVFGAEIDGFIDTLFATTQELTVRRLGLKYINALTSIAHSIHSVADLDVKATISGDDTLSEFNINFMSNLNARSRALVRVATKGFLSGPVPPDTTLFVEVDVHTPEPFVETKMVEVKRWAHDAHEMEKREFFHLFKQSWIESYKAE
jgi:uncharacterized protein (TIGR04255 family)